MALCRTKQFIRVKRDESSNIFPHSAQKKQVGVGNQNALYNQNSNYFETNIYQKKWKSVENKLNRIPSVCELMNKIESNEYDKIQHKQNYFLSTNRASYTKLDANIIRQPVYKDYIKTPKIQQQTDTDIFKSINQADFYKNKVKKMKPELLQPSRSRVRFIDTVQNQQIALKVGNKVNPVKKYDAKKFSEKSQYQIAFNEKRKSTSSHSSSDSEFEYIQAKQNKNNPIVQKLMEKKSKKNISIKKKGILVNPKNQNIIETYFSNKNF